MDWENQQINGPIILTQSWQVDRKSLHGAAKVKKAKASSLKEAPTEFPHVISVTRRVGKAKGGTMAIETATSSWGDPQWSS